MLLELIGCSAAAAANVTYARVENHMIDDYQLQWVVGVFDEPLCNKLNLRNSTLQMHV
jgi:hypothetical protein